MRISEIIWGKLQKYSKWRFAYETNLEMLFFSVYNVK